MAVLAGLPPIYPITPEGLSGPSLARWTSALLEAGCRLLQFRRKSGPDERRLADLEALLKLARPAGCRVIVDDRVDLCLMAGAHGVHLGQEDLPVPEARRLLGPDRIIGFSTHNLEQAREALSLPADYLALGPVFPTHSKERPDPVVPVAVQEEVLRLGRLPVVAIGGITPGNGGELLRRGFASLAVLSAFQEDPAAWQRFEAVVTRA